MADGSDFDGAVQEDGRLYDLLVHSASVRANVFQCTPDAGWAVCVDAVRGARAGRLVAAAGPQCLVRGESVGPHVRYGRGPEADIARVRALFADLDVKPGKQFDTIDAVRRGFRDAWEYLGVAPWR